MEQKNGDTMKTSSIDELFKKFASSEDGLTDDEAQSRLDEFGRNEILESKTNPILKFLRNFWGPIP